MKLYTNRDYFEPIRALLVAIGVGLLTVSVYADVIGVGYPGFGLTRSIGLVSGILLSYTGFLIP